MGPFGTDSFTPVERLLYFSLCTVFGAPVCYANCVVTLYFVRMRSPLMVAAALAVTTLIAAVPCASVAFVIQLQLGSRQSDFVMLYRLAANLSLLATYFVQCIVHQRVSVAGAATAESAHAAADQRVPEPDDEVDNESRNLRKLERRKRFFDRLAGTTRGELVFIRTRNHFLEVHTTEGSANIRMRMADAVSDLGELGMQVHRCYWVAHGHVLGPARREGRMLLRVTGDHEVPISRSQVQTVRTALRTRSGYHDSSVEPPPA